MHAYILDDQSSNESICHYHYLFPCLSLLSWPDRSIDRDLPSSLSLLNYLFTWSSLCRGRLPFCVVGQSAVVSLLLLLLLAAKKQCGGSGGPPLALTAAAAALVSFHFISFRFCRSLRLFRFVSFRDKTRRAPRLVRSRIGRLHFLFRHDDWFDEALEGGVLLSQSSPVQSSPIQSSLFQSSSEADNGSSSSRSTTFAVRKYQQQKQQHQYSSAVGGRSNKQQNIWFTFRLRNSYSIAYHIIILSIS